MKDKPGKLKPEPVKTVVAAQIGEMGFRIERTTNFLDLRVGITISREKAQELIDKGVKFTVCRNR